MKNKIFTICLALFAAGTLSLLAQNNPALTEDMHRGLGKSYVANNIGDATVTIDGVADEDFWSSATTAGMDSIVGNKLKTELSPDDFSANFKVVWDADYIYVFVSCVDDTLTTGAGTAGDNIEFFFNVDSLYYLREKNNSTDQWRDPYRAAKNFTASQIRVNPETDNYTAGGFAQATGDLTNYDFASNVTETGWDIEVKFPYNLITTTSDTIDKTISAYTEGAVVHFEVSGGDVDGTYAEGEQRQHIINWNSTNADAWKDVRHFGRLVLGPATGIDVDKQLFREFRMYPSLVTDNLIVELNDNFNARSITVVNMLGQQLMRKVNVEKVNIMSMSDLPAGIYLLNVESANGSVSSKKFMKKN